MTDSDEHLDWSRVDAIFDAALELEPDARSAFLDRECGDDAALRSRVAELLVAADGTGPLDRSLPDLAGDLAKGASDEIGAGEGRRIGPWRLVGTVGSGGMGRVFRAERVDGGFDQNVALKILRWDLADARLVERFATERQILADLDDPNIARLVDGGVTDDGLPYLAMELVEGRPIDEAIDGLGIEERLRLFLQVTGAVQHAHQQLVVHRDLKPSNILVTDDGRVKLLDFGIAKILDETSAGRATTHTRAGLATPSYAAPEQFQGGLITTATDVWALGVLLYRMLAGRTPFGEEGDGITWLAQAILEKEPSPPSQVAGGEHRRRLEGDLDTIVLTALSKDPSRRYGSAERLGDDVRHHLEGRPIVARPATFSYRARKFVGRNRRGLTIAAAVVLAIGATVGFYTDRLARERDRAQQQARRTEEVKGFLVSLFEVNDPVVSRGEEITAREMLDLGAERIHEGLSEEPVIQAEMNAVVAGLYQELGRYEEARSHFVDAVDLYRSELGNDSPEVALTLGRLGYVLQDLGDYERAEETLRESLRVQRLFPSQVVEIGAACNQLGMFLSYKGDYAEAEQLLREAEKKYARALGPNDPRRATALSNLGLAIKWSGRMDEAEPIYREALQVRRESLGDVHTDVAVSLDNLGVLLGQRGDYVESEASFREALSIRRKLLGDSHPDVALNLNNLATLFRVQGRLDEAEPIYRQVIEMNRETLGPDHVRVATNAVNLGSVQLSRGQAQDALRLFDEALRIRRATLGDEHVEVANALDHRVDALLELARNDEALDASREALRIARSAVDPQSHDLASSLHGHGEVLLRLDRAAEALAVAQEALEIRQQVLTEDHSDTQATRDLLARCRAATSGTTNRHDDDGS